MSSLSSSFFCSISKTPAKVGAECNGYCDKIWPTNPLNGDEIGQIISARIPEDQNLSEMVHKFMIHSHGIAYNRDSSVCI
ncbi:hypothetical protein BB560_006047 [Smittium megazygosporum]|uniref:Uncharacterized protein n=1 Tax=Smittium megazygosporum TaxID=133381 RepID=A0A2T9YJT1_9FUNG|nr:hypothetical protein BB560_006047 [Smittium megazygosporum]